MKKIISGVVGLTISLCAVMAMADPFPVGYSVQDDTVNASVLPEKKDIKQVPYGFYCCDNGGYRRCVMPIAAPAGSPCYCNGQGYGFTCL